MVGELGHLGMALVWLSPAWYFFDHRKTAALVVAGAFWFGTLPDVDLVLSDWFAEIHHHGVFHTVLVVTILAAVIGPLLGMVFDRIGREYGWFSARARERAYRIGFVAVWVSGLSHVFADILSAPDASTRIEPFWPVVNGPVVLIDVLWYESWWATWGLLLLGVAVNLVAWYRTGGRDESAKSVVQPE
jgi:MFS family permease